MCKLRPHTFFLGKTFTFSIFYTCLIVLFSSTVLFAQISGKVFRDFNANGVKDNTTTFNEPFVSGITVTAYNAAGASIATATTDLDSDADGDNYDLSVVSGTAVRVEFTGLVTDDYPTVAGGTSVQFVTAPSTTTHLGINQPSDYINASESASILLAAANYTTGDPLAGGVTAGKPGFLVWNYANYGDGTNTDPGYKEIPISTMGAVWGVANNPQKNRLYTAAMVKRHLGLGASGVGAIYVIDPTTASPTVSLLTDVTSYAGVNVGTVTRTSPVGAMDNANELSASPANPSWDMDAFDKVGKVGLGGLAIDNNFKKLYAVNLNERNIIEMNIGATGTSTTFSKEIAINDPGAANGNYRPWAITYRNGKLYVGIVGSAETSQDTSKLKAYVVEIDPNTGTNTTISTFPLSFKRGAAGGCCGNDGFYWLPWTSTYANVSSNPTNFWIYPQPILSDIKFDVDGSLILGFMDRLAHQGGLTNFPPNYPTTSLTLSVHNSGDIIRVCNVGGLLQLEYNGLCPTETRALRQGDFSFNSGAGNMQGPGGGEFYWGDFFAFQPYSQGVGATHQEVSFGGLALWRGKGEVVVSGMDPTATANSGGIIKLKNSNGRQSTPISGTYSGYRLYQSASMAAGLGKAAGLGDIELFASAAPIEIGNRVFTDTDSDGVQDANEAGINAVTVKLYKAGLEVASTTTNSSGQYLFTNVDPNTAYEIKILAASFPSGKTVTTANTGGGAAGSAADMRDSDATLSGADAVIAYTTGSVGQNNHTLDFGFAAPPPTITPTISSMGTCACSTTNGYMTVTGLTNLSGANFTTTGTYNNVSLPGYGTVDISYSYAGTGNTVTPDFRNLDITQGFAISSDYTSLGFSGSGTVPGLRNKIAAGQTGILTYNFDQPVKEVRLMVYDVDWDDAVTVTAWDAYGNAITNFSGWIANMGDLSVPIDATLPTWNATTHVISANVANINGERNFVSLRPDVYVSKVVFSFTGTSDVSGLPHTQYTIYSNLGAAQVCTAAMDVSVTWTNPPSAQNIVVSNGAYSQTINVSGGVTSPQVVSLPYPPDGTSGHSITASFTGGTPATATLAYTNQNCGIVCATITAPSADQTICVGTTGTNITVNASINTSNSIKFVKFADTDQILVNSSPTVGELATVYGGTAIATVTPTGASNPYTATYTFATADFPNSSAVTKFYYIYAILTNDASGVCRPVQEIKITVYPSPTFNSVATDVTCYGSNDGTLTISPAIGTAPFTYSKDDGATFQSNGGIYTGLVPTNYYPAIKDANGCVKKCN